VSAGNENPLETLKTRGERYPGFYRAVVRDSNDPDKVNKVKVEVLPMMRGLPTADLPWAIPKFAGRNTVVPNEGATVWVFFEEGDVYKPVYEAQYTIPIKNLKAGRDVDQSKYPITHAHHQDELGDPIHHQTVADAVKADENANLISDGVSPEPQSHAGTEYPYNDITLTPGGIMMELDDTPGARRIHVHHPSGAWLEIDEQGSVHLHVNKDRKIYVEGREDHVTEGEIIIVSHVHVHVIAPRIYLN
jgi:hypothetical protein